MNDDLADEEGVTVELRVTVDVAVRIPETVDRVLIEALADLVDVREGDPVALNENDARDEAEGLLVFVAVAENEKDALAVPVTLPVPDFVTVVEPDAVAVPV